MKKRHRLIMFARCMRSWGRSAQRQQRPRLAEFWLVWASPLKCRTDPLRSFQVAGEWECHSPGMEYVSCYQHSRKSSVIMNLRMSFMASWLGYLPPPPQSSVHGAHPADAGRANEPPRPQCCHLAQQVTPHSFCSLPNLRFESKALQL